jgi:xanthine dehydrogenase YagT iron-sulfur-binding subunit
MVSIAMGLSSDAVAQSTAPSSASSDVSVNLIVNGARHALTLDPRSTVLDVLREHLDLTGTKKGCDQCGACTVLVDGRRVVSCLTLAVMKDGASITTIEGLAKDGTFIHCSKRSSITTRSSAATARRARSARPRA